MPHYFFEVRNGDDTTVRNEGLDLPTAEAAWTEATAACGEMIRDMNSSLQQPGSTWQIKVSDENGKANFKLAFITETFD